MGLSMQHKCVKISNSHIWECDHVRTCGVDTQRDQLGSCSRAFHPSFLYLPSIHPCGSETIMPFCLPWQGTTSEPISCDWSAVYPATWALVLRCFQLLQWWSWRKAFKNNLKKMHNIYWSKLPAVNGNSFRILFISFCWWKQPIITVFTAFVKHVLQIFKSEEEHL